MGRTNATANRRCPVCDGNHKCSWDGDPGFIFCGRRREKVPGFVFMGTCKGDEQFGQFRQEGDPELEERNCDWQRGVRPHSNGNGHAGHSPPNDWEAKARMYAKELTPERRQELAEVLVPLPESALDDLEHLGSGADYDGRTIWTFPERDGKGKIIGIKRRFRAADLRKDEDGKKLMKDAKHGLTILEGWDKGGPIFLVEGASDTLILHAMGLSVIGRPNNNLGVELLAVLLRDYPDRQIIVLGEHDEKEDGSWPGRDGAKNTAAKLSVQLGRPGDDRARWCLPPDGAKDVRAWAKTKITDRDDPDDWAHAGATLSTYFMANLIGDPEPVTLADAEPVEEEPNESFTPFPLDTLPTVIRDYVEAGAAAVGCDPSFVALPMLSMLGGAIGLSRRVQAKKGWTEPPILWTAIIGESGTTKSPAIDLAKDFPNRRQKDARKRHAAELKIFEELKEQHEIALKKWKKEREDDPELKRPEPPQEPVLERPIVDDTTVEAVGPILVDNPRGVLILKDELANWFSSFDRYSGKQAKASGDATKWIEMHGGRSITIDRRTGTPKTLFIPLAAVGVGGGIQPGIIRSAITAEHRANGLLARLLMAYPPRRPRRWSDAVVADSIKAEVQKVYDQLWQLRPMTTQDGDQLPVLISLSPEATAMWKTFVDTHGAEQFQLEGDLAAAWSKLECYAIRIALIHHLVRVASGERPDPENGIDAESMEAGIRMVRWFGAEDHRIYAMLHEKPEAAARRSLVEHIRRHCGSITARDLKQTSRRYPNHEAANAALNDLVKAKLAVWDPQPPGPKGGRPTFRCRLTS